jgi:hypothetical protein
MRFVLTCLLLWLPVSSAIAKNAVYDHPKYYSDGLPIDYCLYPTKQCGHAAANHFCNDMNAGSVISFKAGRVNSATHIQGTGGTCDTKKYDHCDAFTQIICGNFTM